MNLIDNYMNSLYKKDNSIEVRELKEEIKEHLRLSAEELMNQGIEEELAYKQAIEKFDGGADMLKELYQINKESTKQLKERNTELRTTKLKYIKILRNITIACIIILLSALYIDRTNYIEVLQAKTWSETSELLEETLNEFSKEIDINNIYEHKEELDRILSSKEFESITMLRIYSDEDDYIIFSEEDEDIKYQYGDQSIVTPFESASEIETNSKNQVWQYRYKQDTLWYYNIETTFIWVSLAVSLISLICYILAKTTYKKEY